MLPSALETFIRRMPKVELHIHLEGSVLPETLLRLAQKNHIPLPAADVEGIRHWYQFSNFAHFVQVYIKISSCLRSPDDIETIAREFILNQVNQNIRYTEATYTAYTHYESKGLSFEDQLAALNRARVWGEKEFGFRMGFVIDIAREKKPEAGLINAEWVIRHYGDGVIAFGLGGSENGNPPEKFRDAFDRVHAAGIPCVPHAGEIEGPASIWGALNALHAVRIGHGVRCLEDPELVAYLREKQVPLEVNPTSNVCLGVFPTLAAHALPRLIAEGLYVTINSDDPPMFNTTLTDEYLRCAQTFQFNADDIEKLVMNGVRASLLPVPERLVMEADFARQFAALRQELAL